MGRGRPPLRMTHHRKAVMNAIIEAGQPVTFSRLARVCGLYDYRDARRIVADLKKMGVI